jgi:hypothetical protein
MKNAIWPVALQPDKGRLSWVEGERKNSVVAHALVGHLEGDFAVLEFSIFDGRLAQRFRFFPKAYLLEGSDMTRPVVFVPLVFLLTSTALADDLGERPATELLSAGLVHAKDQSKRVFLLFGSPG